MSINLLFHNIKIFYIFGSKTGLKLVKTKAGSKTAKDHGLQSFVVHSGLLQS